MLARSRWTRYHYVICRPLHVPVNHYWCHGTDSDQIALWPRRSFVGLCCAHGTVSFLSFSSKSVICVAFFQGAHACTNSRPLPPPSNLINRHAEKSPAIEISHQTQRRHVSLDTPHSIYMHTQILSIHQPNTLTHMTKLN